jgi:hypothetical protein
MQTRLSRSRKRRWDLVEREARATFGLVDDDETTQRFQRRHRRPQRLLVARILEVEALTTQLARDRRLACLARTKQSNERARSERSPDLPQEPGTNDQSHP